jgi:hypothetical protein
MSEPFVHVAIRVFGSAPQYAESDSQDEAQIINLVRKEVLPREKAEYRSVNVKVKRREDGSPEYLVTYLLRKDTYTADVVRVDIDENYDVQAFHDDYADAEEDEGEVEDEEADAYAPVDFVVSTPCDDIPTAVAAVDEIYDMATNAGLSAVKLKGPQATVAAYRSYLAAGVRGFVNIGHGNPSLIVLYDGTLTATWFQGLAGRRVAPAVVYFNSCQVFNNPLQPAVMGAGARTFVGGIVNLLIGASEEVCKCFWRKTLAQRAAMRSSLTSCEQEHYPTEGAHGFSGDTGRFNFISSPIDAYKVVLYGEDALAGELVAYIHCYYQRKNVMSCEFYRDGAVLPQNRYKGGRVGLVYPWSHFSAVLDVLRNEKPVYFGFILSTKVGYVATHLEPVGEGSDTS